MKNDIVMSNEDSDKNELRDYTKIKLSLADQLRIIRQGMASMGLKDAVQNCEDLIVKLAEDRFTLAVLGQFKRGKSSLMNAILGKEILPTGVLPLTLAITILKYGPEERLVVANTCSSYPNEHSVSELADYVTEKGNPGNEKKVKQVVVEMPLPFLRYGLHFVDTPGVGSASQTNTDTTYRFLPECDAVIFVTGIDTPLTTLELDFLKNIDRYARKIFFVLNKIDLVNKEEEEELIGFVTRNIMQETGMREVKIFPVSARMAIEAAQTGNDAMWENSGIKPFEDALSSFLSGEKTAIFLTDIARKVLDIVNKEINAGTLSDESVKARILSLKNEEDVTVYQDQKVAVQAIWEAKSRLEKIDLSINDGKPSVPVSSHSTPEAIANKDSKAIVTPLEENDIELPQSLPETRTTMQQGRCPVCARITDAAMNFFARWQYKIASEEKAQKIFAEALGFCPLHTWQLISVSSPYGASVGFAALAEKIADMLRQKAANPEHGEDISSLIHNSGNCDVCRLLAKEEKAAVKELAEMLNSEEGLKQFEQSGGICIRHLDMLLKQTNTPSLKKKLLLHLADQLGRNAEDMRSYAMKHDAHHRDLENKDEKSAYRRAVTSIVGEKSVCSPWPEDGVI